MKTLETEKHNIPEGATHYAEIDNCPEIVWMRLTKDKTEVYLGFLGEYIPIHLFSDRERVVNVKPIPQQEVEWNGKGLPPVGVACEWIDGGIAHGDWGMVIVHAYNADYAWIEKLFDNSMHTVRTPAFFRKPESPEEKEKRERLKASYDLYVTGQESLDVIGYQDFDDFASDLMQVKFYNSIVDKTNYRK